LRRQKLTRSGRVAALEVAMTKPKALIAGETWITTSIHTKGFDSFATSSFGEGYSMLKSALERCGFDVDVIENHVAPTKFPTEREALDQYAAVILSDIGANTLLLAPETWQACRPTTNRLDLIADYVRGGGGLVMVGGYLTFTGVEAKGFWKGTPVEDVLPVRLSPHDDRSEHPEGVIARVVERTHPVLAGVPQDWPPLLGYNRVEMRFDSTLVASIGSDPLIAVREVGKGRTAVFTSDCSPHWAPPAFTSWPGYEILWSNICRWAAGA
jgi:uncharacterized membrane protein